MRGANSGVTIDHVATARWTLAYARTCLETAKDTRERRLLRQNIAQLEAWLARQGTKETA